VGLVLARRYIKLGCKCVLDKRDAIVDLEHHLGLVLSNSINSLTSIDSSHLISVYQIRGTTIQNVVNTFSLVVSDFLVRKPLPYLDDYSLTYI